MWHMEISFIAFELREFGELYRLKLSFPSIIHRRYGCLLYGSCSLIYACQIMRLNFSKCLNIVLKRNAPYMNCCKFGFWGRGLTKTTEGFVIETPTLPPELAIPAMTGLFESGPQSTGISASSGRDLARDHVPLHRCRRFPRALSGVPRFASAPLPKVSCVAER